MGSAACAAPRRHTGKSHGDGVPGAPLGPRTGDTDPKLPLQLLWSRQDKARAGSLGLPG